MSRLTELIQDLCPNGVEHHELEDIAQYCKQRIDASAVNADTYVGVENLLQNKQGKVRSSAVPASGQVIAFTVGDILIGNIRPYLKKIWLANCAGGTNGDVLAIHIVDNRVLPKFLYYELSSDSFFLYDMQNAKGAKMPRGSKDAVMQYVVPVPPIPVQYEIVRILDTFTELTSELTENLSMELTARKQQYEYYRNKLLDKQQRSTKIITIGELGAWSGGKTPSMDNSDYWENGTIPWISSKDMKASTLEDTEDHITEQAVNEAAMTVYPANGIAVVTRSGILKHTLPVAFVPFETTVNQDIKMLTVYESVLPRYAFHAIQGKSPDILTKAKKQGGTVDSLEFKKFLDYKIPLPSLAVQQRLVEVLDNFDAICSDLNIGLPAEIEARKKQYEFYRDQLLTFAAQDEIVLTDRQTDRQICNISRGKVISKTDIIEQAGTYPVYSSQTENNGELGKIDSYMFDGEYVTWTTDGANAGTVFYRYGKFNITNVCGLLSVMDSSVLLEKYLFYFLQKNAGKYVNAGMGNPKLMSNVMASIKIDIPSLSEQKRIIAILDHFSTLCTDLTSGLPAEIEARKKQYEYYRDKLLSFTPAD